MSQIQFGLNRVYSVSFLILILGFAFAGHSMAEDSLSPQDFEGKYVLDETKKGNCSVAELNLKYDPTSFRLYSEELNGKDSVIEFTDINQGKKVTSHESYSELKGAWQILYHRSGSSTWGRFSELSGNRLRQVKYYSSVASGHVLVIGAISWTSAAWGHDLRLDREKKTLTFRVYTDRLIGNKKSQICVYKAS